LSPECGDPWAAVIEVVSRVQSRTGDTNDLNYIIRSRKLEEELSVAVENDAKLSIANAKIKSLEKNLLTRSNEISLQNARLDELEKMLARADQTSNGESSKRPTPSEGHQELKEEIRVLNEAIEVLQGQVDEYEREIRTLKDQKSKNNRHGLTSTAKGTSLDALSLASDLENPRKIRSEQGFSSMSLESALFRPALQNALSSASLWKSKFVLDKIHRLPPLLSKDCSGIDADMLNQNRQLSLALGDMRLVKAGISIIRLKDSKSNAVEQVYEKQQKELNAMRRLKALTEVTRFSIAANVA